MAVLDHLEPKEVFRFFEEISSIPRGTFYTKKISDYCADFARQRNLPVIQDEANNIIITKPGTPGYEQAEPVILQGHLDMVCDKTEDTIHDFTKEGLELYTDDGFIKAKGTTLGGDDGIAVAMVLALLDSHDILHPPLEALFTTDEESGMGGAIAVDLHILKGHKLINIDSEEEGYLTVGCAGGITCHTYFDLSPEQAEGELTVVRISGLTGGHSGSDIHLQRGNALKLMGRLLHTLDRNVPVRLVSLNGGSKENVIAMDCTAALVIPKEYLPTVKAVSLEMEEIWKNEFMGEEPSLTVSVSVKGSICTDAASSAATKQIISYLFLMPYGPQDYSRKLPGQVETSLNPGVAATENNTLAIHTLVRSSVESKKQDLACRLSTLASLCGGRMEQDGDYPGWMYKEISPLRDLMVDTYKEMYKKEPEVMTIHAGLECGLFLGKRPDLDCVSFGPDIFDVHSVRERLSIASVERTYRYLKLVLSKCK